MMNITTIIKKGRLLPVLLSFVAMGMMAVPAKRVKKTLVLADGTTVEAVLTGDENVHYYTAADGRKYVPSADKNVFRLAEDAELEQRRMTRAAAREQHREVRRARRRAQWGAESNPMSGHKKGLVILVNFADKEMTYGRSTYLDFFNKEGYSDYHMGGSVHDYFYSQSYGQFNLTFDVVGPVTVSRELSYYGKNNSDGDDEHPAEMVAEACRLADSSVNFADYDWDDDGEVDQVYVIYAGYGEAQGGALETIWPHEYELTSSRYFGDGPGAITLDGVRVDTYACSCELSGKSGTNIDGIGTACHEFSHCMCLPDMYDTSEGNSNFGMDIWDLMDYGCYNGYHGCGETPVGYTSYERMYCGWLTPVELDEGCDVKNMKPLTSEPEAYIIYNQANRNEFYLLENHQQEGWNRYSPAHGMLVLHVDFDSRVWAGNTVNAAADRQRMTIIPADGSTTRNSTQGDTWPGTTMRNALTDVSQPAATLYRTNTDGRKLLGRPIENITEQNGLISFVFNGGSQLPVPIAYEPTEVGTNSFTALWSEVTEARAYELQLIERDTFKLSPSEALLLAEDFSGFNIGISAGNKDVGEQKLLDEYTQTPGWTGYKLFATNTDEVKVGTSKEAGYIVTPSFEEPETGSVTVRVVCRRYPNDTGGLRVLVNDAEVGTILPNDEETSYVFTIDCSAAFQVTLATTAKRAYVSSLEVYDGTYTETDLASQANAPRRARQMTTYEVMGTSYAFTDLDTSKSYSYRVRALSNTVVSEWSNMVRVFFEGQGNSVLSPMADRRTYIAPWQRDVYDLQGRRISEGTLPRGIYIVGGRKVMSPKR